MKLIEMNNNDSPGEVFWGETFWVYHFMPLGTSWGLENRKWRTSYRNKAYFEAQGMEIMYDETMIKQAEKHGL